MKKENLNWNEAVKAMKEGKVVKMYNYSYKYRIKEDTLEFTNINSNLWYESTNNGIELGSRIYNVIEEEKKTLYDKRVGTAYKGSDVEKALKEFIDYLVKQNDMRGNNFNEAIRIFGDRLIK